VRKKAATTGGFMKQVLKRRQPHSTILFMFKPRCTSRPAPNSVDTWDALQQFWRTGMWPFRYSSYTHIHQATSLLHYCTSKSRGGEGYPCGGGCVHFCKGRSL